MNTRLEDYGKGWLVGAMWALGLADTILVFEPYQPGTVWIAIPLLVVYTAVTAWGVAKR